MRAVVLRGGRLRVDDVPDLVPGPGQVLLDVAYAGICGSDLHARDHVDASADVAAEVGYPRFARSDQDVVLGHEFVGRVAAYGPGTHRRWPVGTPLATLPLLRVGADLDMTGYTARVSGGFAEQVLVTEDASFAVPESVPLTAAALVEPLAVAYHAVRRGRVRRRDTAVVVGCGPIGLAVVLVLKARGVRHVVASDPSPQRRDLARRCGADVVVDPGTRSPWDVVGPDHVTSAVDLYGRGLDALRVLRRVDRVPWAGAYKAARAAGAAPRGPVVFECVGVPGMIEHVVTHAPFCSRVVVVGVCMEPDTFRPTMAVNKELDLHFSFCYDPADVHDTVALMGRGRLDATPLVTGVVGLDGVADAFDALAAAPEHAKVLVDPRRPAP